MRDRETGDALPITFRPMGVQGDCDGDGGDGDCGSGACAGDCGCDGGGTCASGCSECGCGYKDIPVLKPAE